MNIEVPDYGSRFKTAYLNLAVSALLSLGVFAMLIYLIRHGSTISTAIYGFALLLVLKAGAKSIRRLRLPETPEGSCSSDS